MKRLISKILHHMNGVSFGSFVLLLMIWLVAQIAVSSLAFRLFWFDEKMTAQAWMLLDKVSPSGFFLTSLSLPYAFFRSGAQPLFMTTLNGVLQYILWMPFSWLLARKISAKENSVPAKLANHLKVLLVLLPIFVASSLAGLLIQIVVENSALPGLWKPVLSGIVPDFVSLTLFFTFVPAMYFGFDGYGIRQSLKHSILAFRKRFWMISLLILSVLAVLSLLSQALLEAGLMSAGMYGLARMALQVAGWIAFAGIWFLTGFAYHDYKACLNEPFVRKPEGVGYEQILETPSS